MEALATRYVVPYVNLAMGKVEQLSEPLLAQLEAYPEVKEYVILVEGYVYKTLGCVRKDVNAFFVNLEPYQIVLFTLAVAYVIASVHKFLFTGESIGARFKKSFFKFVKKIPFVSGQIEKELKKTRASMADIIKPVPNEKYNKRLPAKGLSNKELMANVEFLEKMGHVDWKGGKISGTVYHGGEDLTELLVDVYKRFCWSNPLHADVFPGVRKMEAEVVQMVVNMFNGNQECCGTMTSGGTESILMAVKSYRDYAYEVKGITEPELVVPVSSHAAFGKACGYFK
eukprot:Colp12_sorted_trinity150504_noHs@36186